MVVLGIAVGLEVTTEQIAAYGQRLRQATDRLTEAISGSSVAE
jgi:hypothetical protein